MGLVRHLLLVKFKPGITHEQRQALVDDVKMLPGRISVVKDLWLGFDVGRGNADFTLCTDFASVEDFDKYARHPAHHALFAKISPVMSPQGLTATLINPDLGLAMHCAKSNDSYHDSITACGGTHVRSCDVVPSGAGKRRMDALGQEYAARKQKSALAEEEARKKLWDDWERAGKERDEWDAKLKGRDDAERLKREEQQRLGVVQPRTPHADADAALQKMKDHVHAEKEQNALKLASSTSSRSTFEDLIKKGGSGALQQWAAPIEADATVVGSSSEEAQDAVVRQLRKLSIKELKLRLQAHSVDLAGACEKEDLVRALIDAIGPQAALVDPPALRPASEPAGNGKPKVPPVNLPIQSSIPEHVRMAIVEKRTDPEDGKELTQNEFRERYTAKGFDESEINSYWQNCKVVLTKGSKRDMDDSRRPIDPPEMDHAERRIDEDGQAHTFSEIRARALQRGLSEEEVLEHWHKCPLKGAQAKKLAASDADKSNGNKRHSDSEGRRRDPDDGKSFTLEGLLGKYKDMFDAEEIEAYWHDECEPEKF